HHLRRYQRDPAAGHLPRHLRPPDPLTNLVELEVRGEDDPGEVIRGQWCGPGRGCTEDHVVLAHQLAVDAVRLVDIHHHPGQPVPQRDEVDPSDRAVRQPFAPVAQLRYKGIRLEHDDHDAGALRVADHQVAGQGLARAEVRYVELACGGTG